MSTTNQASAVSIPRPKGVSAGLHRKLDRYLLACSATTAAVAAAGASDAKAAIIYSGTQNIAIPALSAAGIYFDFDTNTASFTRTNGSDANIFDVYGTGTYNGQQAFYHSVSFWGPNKTGNMSLANLTTTLGSTMRLTAGTSIGSALPSGMVFGRQNDLANQFYNYNTAAPVGAFTGNWSAGGTGYIGFKFVAANGQTDYGWMRVSLNPVNFQNQMVSATVIDWAYNNTGGAILAGQIPEPSSLALALLGGGAVGLALWRQHRARREEKS